VAAARFRNDEVRKGGGKKMGKHAEKSGKGKVVVRWTYEVRRGETRLPGGNGRILLTNIGGKG